MRALRRLGLALAAMLVVTGLVLAQGTEPRALDYERWESTAVRAESALGDAETTDTALEALRGEIATYRQRFQEAQAEQGSRLSTLQAQIDTLGPPPAEGATEADDIAARRAELNRQLAEARAPVLAAEEAYTRADGLIREIDNTIRTRQAEEMLALGPSPAVPSHWQGAARELAGTAAAMAQETADAWGQDNFRAALVNRLPSLLTLLVLGGLLTVRGPHWVHVAVNLLRRRTRRGTGVWQFLLSLGQIVLPLLGVYAFASAVRISGLVGPRVITFLEWLPLWVGIGLFVRWLAEQTFSRNDDVATLPIPRARRSVARYIVTIIGLLLILRGVVNTLNVVAEHGPETQAVLNFPITVLSALMVFRLAQILRTVRLTGEAEGDAAQAPDESDFRLRFLRGAGQLMLVLSLAAPVVALIGYANLAEAMVFKTVATLMLLGSLTVLLRLMGDIYHLITGKTPEEAQSLILVLVSFVMFLGTLPLLALIWGARVTDLTELYARFAAGFTVGETQIAPTDFLGVILVFVIGYVLTRLVQGALRSSVLPKTRIDIGGRNAIVAGLGYAGVIGSFLLAISSSGMDLTSLAFIAGGLSLGVGFGLQTIVQNFVAGIILLIERPISEGDWIQVGDQMGYVRDISVRSTVIETFDRTDVIVPNANLITDTVTNFTRGNSLGRIIVPVGVAYGTDTRLVESVLLGIAREHPQVMMNPAPYIYFKRFGENAMEFEIRAILIDVNLILDIQTEMNHQIAERFKAAGIQIPFAQRDIWLRNPETLFNPEAENTHHSSVMDRAVARAAQDKQDKEAARKARHAESTDTAQSDGDAGDGGVGSASGDGSGDGR